MAATINHERKHPSGAIGVTALVTDGRSTWFEHQTYYGYTVREARAMFRAHVAEQGWTVERD